MNIVRGAMGFGFTIADSSYGQRVKQILDKTRCKNLMEGDVLLEINNNNVKDMSHAEVVQVLKDCPKGDETTIVVQRGGKSSNRKYFSFSFLALNLFCVDVCVFERLLFL